MAVWDAILGKDVVEPDFRHRVVRLAAPRHIEATFPGRESPIYRTYFLLLQNREAILECRARTTHIFLADHRAVERLEHLYESLKFLVIIAMEGDDVNILANPADHFKLGSRAR